MESPQWVRMGQPFLASSSASLCQGRSWAPTVTLSFLINATLCHRFSVTSCPWSVPGLAQAQKSPFHSDMTLSPMGEPQGHC